MKGKERAIRAFNVQQGSFQVALSLEKMKVLGGEVRSFGRAGPLREELSEAVIGRSRRASGTGTGTVLSYGASWIVHTFITLPLFCQPRSWRVRLYPSWIEAESKSFYYRFSYLPSSSLLC